MHAQGYKSNEEFYGRIDFESVIFNHLIRISWLSTHLFETSDGSMWQKNVLNYYYSVKALEATVVPYLDKEYRDGIIVLESDMKIKYEDRHKEDKTRMSKLSKFDDVRETIDVTNETLKLITMSLKKNGLLIPSEVGVVAR